MNRRTVCFSFAGGLFLALCALALPVAVGGENPAVAFGDVRAARDGLIVTTHGSHWYHFENRWRYPAFETFADQLDVVTTVPLDELLDQYPEIDMAEDERRWFTYTLGASLAGSIIFDLRGASSDFNGLQATMYVYDPTGAEFLQYERTYERSLHLDQPVAGEYNIQLRAYRQSTCTLQIGSGQSPFLATSLDSYSFVLLPDTAPLSVRELERIHRFVQNGGNLVVLAEYIWGPRYYSMSDFASLNQVLSGCGIELTGQLLTTTQTITANQQAINVLRDVRPHRVTEAITEVVSTGSTLALSGSAQGLVYDEAGDPVIAVGTNGSGQCLVLGTAIGFNADFRLQQNDRLAENIIDWASRRMSYRVLLPLVLKQKHG